jgi:bifunctional non-homologous end joining protein LigD
MQTERAELYFRQGSSDKVYHLQLEKENDQWSVRAQWSRRGSSLQSDVKANGVAYEEAKHVYDRILREKRCKGYQVSQATANVHTEDRNRLMAFWRDLLASGEAREIEARRIVESNMRFSTLPSSLSSTSSSSSGFRG